MYVGHVGVALGAKGMRGSIGLLALLLAAYAPDWVDSCLCVAAKYDPAGLLSHSLPAAGAAALTGFVLYAVTTRDVLSALVVSAVVLSHIPLDWITGHKATWPDGPMIGLRLYDHPVADLVVEAGVIVVGALIYRRSLPRRPGAWRDVGLMIGALLFLQLGVTVVRALTVDLPKC